MEDSNQLDVLLIQRADISYYPPTINQANILAESGLRVAILDGGKRLSKLQSLHHKVIRYSEVINKNFDKNSTFILFFRKILKQTQARVCIAYDPAAASLLGGTFYSGKRVFHFHECPGGDAEGGEPFSATLQVRLAIYFSRRVDLVVFADSHRASSFFKEYGLTILPTVVRNCPRKLLQLPKGVLRSKLEEAEIQYSYIVLFQGSVSKNYHVDRIVESMKYWLNDIVMVFIGPVNSDFKLLLQKLADSNGVEDRLIFLGQVPYKNLFAHTVDADIGFSMIKPATFNFTHMAGASNKRYELMTCGVPQISNIGPGMRELIEDNEVGVCVDANDIKKVGKAVNALLQDKAKRSNTSLVARKRHIQRFNYEIEFKPVLEKITNWCSLNNEG